MRTGRPKKSDVVTEEDVIQIKKDNREKLDYIFSQGPEYMIELAIKYYGENWMTVFGGEETYLHTERNRHNVKHGGLRSKDGNRSRPIVKLDMNTEEVIQSYDTVYQCVEEEGLTHTQMTTLIATLTGRYESYKGYKWRFADEKKIMIYGE